MNPGVRIGAGAVPISESEPILQSNARHQHPGRT